MEEFSFTHYLSAKKTVDDRALNQRVWDTLSKGLSFQSRQGPVRILEMGCGIGTMIERIVERRLIRNGEYTGLDFQVENLAFARLRLQQWAARAGIQWRETSAGRFLLQSDFLNLSIEFIHTDVTDFISQPERASTWDLLIANAFLDLVDIKETLPRFLKCLHQGGLFYFTLNFDGLTIFEPEIDPKLDEEIQRLYHLTMDQRRSRGGPSGDSRTGRRLFLALRDAGAVLLEAGASDWVVYPNKGGYQDDEANFLHYIIRTIEGALHGNPGLSATLFEGWIAERHSQVERGELVYIAHQIDFVGRI